MTKMESIYIILHKLIVIYVFSKTSLASSSEVPVKYDNHLTLRSAVHVISFGIYIFCHRLGNSDWMSSTRRRYKIKDDTSGSFDSKLMHDIPAPQRVPSYTTIPGHRWIYLDCGSVLSGNIGPFQKDSFVINPGSQVNFLPAVAG